MHNIVVIGAGVVGLTNALEIKRAFPGVSVTIVAKNLPGDFTTEYTSPFAGANWDSFASVEEKELQEMDAIGYRRLIELSEEPAAGIWRKENILYFDETTVKQNDSSKLRPWFKSVVNNYRELDASELPEGAAWGYSFGGLVISVQIYLQYLIGECLREGIVIKRTKELKSVQEARKLHSSGKNADTVINCAGILVSRLGGFKDPSKSFPVLGQVLVTRNSLENIEVFQRVDPDYPNEIPYIFPRKEGGSIIGGCFRKEVGPGPVVEDKELTKRLIERATKLVPQLTDTSYKNNPPHIDVVRVQVGLRPFREGGIRIEQDSEHEWLIHSYGAGAGGYQGSYGFSHKVVQLLSSRINNSKL
ncbi:hypothetical protein JA9_000658 [Meyerozyma sp. JA9]|nr:hypothetical protein JA9_000658 [Meyerozyma sp. JA9]